MALTLLSIGLTSLKQKAIFFVLLTHSHVYSLGEIRIISYLLIIS